MIEHYFVPCIFPFLCFFFSLGLLRAFFLNFLAFFVFFSHSFFHPYSLPQVCSFILFLPAPSRSLSRIFSRPFCLQHMVYYAPRCIVLLINTAQPQLGERVLVHMCSLVSRLIFEADRVSPHRTIDESCIRVFFNSRDVIYSSVKRKLIFCFRGNRRGAFHRARIVRR